MPIYPQNRGASGRGILPQRTLDFLAHGAPKGNRNAELYAAAQQFKAAGYTFAETEARLYPVAIDSGLGEYEARRSITSGYNSEQVNDPIGGSNPPGSAFRHPGGNSNHGANGPPPVSPPPKPASSSAGLPKPIPNGFVVLMQSAFLPGEQVSISGIEVDASGTRRPGRGDCLAQEKQIARATRIVINQVYTDPDGAYIRINPMTLGGASDKDVANLRNTLIEFDLDENGNRIPKVTQWEIIVNSPFPKAAVIDSGDKSLHAWIRLDAGTDFDLFKLRREIVFGYFAQWNVDSKNKNPSRYSRCPEINRNLYGENGICIGIGRQELLAVNLGPASWADYERAQAQSERDSIAAVLAIRTISDLPAIAPPQLVKGVLYQGGKMSFGGGSKSFKTWNVIHLLFCIANGLPYLGFPVLSGPVLLIDFELFSFEIRQRFEAIARVYQLADPFHNISVITLRGEYLDFGHPVVFDVLSEKILAGAFIIFAFDPLYKALNGYDENSNSDVARVLRPFERLTVLTSASFVYCQHFSKGNQTAKDPIDRIAGAGGFGRDPDCLAMYTAHALPDCFTVNIVQRSFDPIAPFVVRWKHPVYFRDDSVDPDDLAPPKKMGRPKSNIDSLIMAAISAAESSGGLTFGGLVAATGIPKATLSRRLKELIGHGEIFLSAVTKTYQLSPRNAAKWNAQNQP